MSSTQIIDDDEIDLFEVFETLWNGKWKIVTATVITTVIGVILGVFFPGTYTGSTLLSKAEESTFTKYTFINTTLKNSGFDYSINSGLAFNLFLSEFEDYEEILEVLKKNNYTNNLLQKTDANNRDYVMAQLVKDFKIIPPSKKIKNGLWSTSGTMLTRGD